MLSVTTLVVRVTADIVPEEKFGTTGTARLFDGINNNSSSNFLIFCDLDESYRSA